MWPLSQVRTRGAFVYRVFTFGNETYCVNKRLVGCSPSPAPLASHYESLPFVHHLTTGRLRKALMIGVEQKSLLTLNPRGEVLL